MNESGLFQRLGARVTELFPAGVGVGVCGSDIALYDGLFHVEQRAILGAAPARQREFLAGRMAARRAQQALGRAPQPVLMGADRAPVWPAGLRGSISHAGRACVAVVTDDPAIAAMGVDIEDDAPLPKDIHDTVLLPEEQHWIGQQTSPDLLARLFFSAKECAYKAQYPLTRQLFGFDVITIRPDLLARSFEAQFMQAVPPFASGALLAGRFSIDEGLIITAVTIPA
ncbi:MAG: 4'-phosphopantetheinyl transferase superfamily protein [Pararhodobacter sp.]|nr:4'-phosphopantetheinyl transferase superfamily protein [Pararhodobacter sp.]